MWIERRLSQDFTCVLYFERLDCYVFLKILKNSTTAKLDFIFFVFILMICISQISHSYNLKKFVYKLHYINALWETQRIISYKRRNFNFIKISLFTLYLVTCDTDGCILRHSQEINPSFTSSKNFLRMSEEITIQLRGRARSIFESESFP